MPSSDAEYLLEVADGVLHPRNRLLLSQENPPHACDVVVLALRLYERKDVAFRAQMEGWTRVRIVRELY